MADIVVGIDGSDRSNRALKWAIDEGVQRGVGVQVVHVFSPPDRSFTDELATLPPGQSIDEPGRSSEERYESARRRARDRIAQLVRDAGGGRIVAGVDIHVIPGRHPSSVLLEQAEGAVMLVLANRGLGGLRGSLMGSVTLHCSQHATCPVVIIPAGTQDDAGPASVEGDAV